jgi:hypothetical protein
MADATVLELITVAQVPGRNLSFSTVTAGITKTVTTSGTVTAGTATSQEKSAAFRITKAASVPSQLTVSGLENLVGIEAIAGTQLLTSYVVDIAGNLDPQSGAIDFGSAGQPSRTLDIDNASPLYADGEIFVRIGGTVSPTGAQAPGTYNREITLTAVYN